MAVEQVEVSKLLAVTMDCKLSWSKHIDTTVAKMGRSISMIKHCSTFFTARSTMQVLQALVLSHLNWCSVVWSGATKKGLRKIAIGSEQGSTAGPWIYTESYTGNITKTFSLPTIVS